MASRLTKEQEQKNSGMFIHEDLFLDEVKKLEDAIAGTGVVKKVNGKSPNSSGEVTLDAGDIKTTDGTTTVEASLENKLDVTTLATELAKTTLWTDMIARIKALEDAAKTPS